MERQLGIFLWFSYPLPVEQRARLIREAGFDAVLLWWEDMMEQGFCTKRGQVSACGREDLHIENVHLPFYTVNRLWLDGLAGDGEEERIRRCIEELPAYGIRTAVLHASVSPDPPPPGEIGIARFRRLADAAERHSVRIALENTRHTEHLHRALAAIPSPMLGFCYDSGHDFAYSTNPYQLLDQYADRLFAVHLHDNHGDKDAHLPPGEGAIDWALIRRKLEARFEGAYALECDGETDQGRRTAREHLILCYESAKKYLLGKP